MAKTKTKASSGSKDILRSAKAPLVKSIPKTPKSEKPTEDLVAEASTLLEQSQPDLALLSIREALQRLNEEPSSQQDIDLLLLRTSEGKATLPVALILSADIALALGDVETAQAQYLAATQIDPDGALISAEPWLQLAQLCEDGGRKSMEYFEQATDVLRNEIEVLEEVEAMAVDKNQEVLDERRAKLANALCGMAELYMTDLSWEVDAEAACEHLVTEAVAVCPERVSAGVLQVLASVRISQERFEDAKQALTRSMSLWKDIPTDQEDPARPEFATRVSLARLLMEVEVEVDAFAVLDGLVKEDDQSVEAWYLGGWCQVLLSQKPGSDTEQNSKATELARLWLGNCLKLYKIQDYQDERLQEHALELVAELNKTLGIDGNEEEWEDAEDDEQDDDDDESDLEVETDATNGNNDKDEDVEMT